MLSIRNDPILPDNHRNITFTFLINCKCPKDDSGCCEENQETDVSDDFEENVESKDQSNETSMFKWFDISGLSDYQKAEVSDIATEAWQWACRLYTKGMKYTGMNFVTEGLQVAFYLGSMGHTLGDYKVLNFKVPLGTIETNVHCHKYTVNVWF